MKEIYKKGYTQNRELSWLRFNERCLEEALDESIPELEALNFVKIFSGNLDEFFMVRVGSLMDLDRVAPENRDPLSGMSPSRQLKQISKNTRFLYYKREQIYEKVRKNLREKEVWIKSNEELTGPEREVCFAYFRDVLLKQVSIRFLSGIDGLPELKNNQTVLLGKLDEGYYSVVTFPEEMPALLTLENSSAGFIGIRTPDVLMEFFDKWMLPFQAKEKLLLRVTRNAEFREGEEDELLKADFRAQIQKMLRERSTQPLVRLEIRGNCSDSFREELIAKFKIPKKHCFTTTAPLEYGFLDELKELLPKATLRTLSYPRYTPRSTPTFFEEKVVDYAKRGDILSSYPYDSMMPLLRMLKEAVTDDRVREIRMTIYRLSSHTQIAEYLAQAAENGKKVKVLIELRARFDEQNNINWSRRLERAGCKIYYGSESMDDYKVHCKICQVVLEEMGEKRYLTQVGTGNYNETTAKLYTDFSLITYNQPLGKDVSRFFKNICKNRYFEDYKYILAAPQGFKQAILQQIESETAKGKKGRIFIKVNSMTDPDVIRKLSEASGAGVKIRMIVRGICCLLPGVAKRTENIDVVNVVGRYLEHSRVYIFGSGKKERMYISSADLMTRNTEKRVELAFPVIDPKVRSRIKNTLLLNYMDNVKGRRLDSEGCYRRKDVKGESVNSQQRLMDEQI